MFCSVFVALAKLFVRLQDSGGALITCGLELVGKALVAHSHDLDGKDGGVFRPVDSDGGNAPAKCAAMPASAMIQENPLSRADAANSLASFGHRWADNTRISVSIPYSLSVWIAFSATGRSLVLPIITATFRIVLPP